MELLLDVAHSRISPLGSMLRVFLLRTLFVLSCFLFQLAISSAYASGTVRQENRTDYRGAFDTSIQKSARRIDETYEYGRSIYQGNLAGATKYNYCVELDGEKVPVKRKSLKPFKKSTYFALANGLYDCDRPDVLIGLEIPHDSFQYVIYYLNKRYKLNLTKQKVN